LKVSPAPAQRCSRHRFIRAVQGLIGRQRAVPELFPFAGAGGIAGHALVAALINPSPRVLFCGGEERGTWLRERGVASERTFAFALAFGRDDATGAAGRVAVIEAADSTAKLSLYNWFGLLEDRKDYDGPLLPGLKLQLVWNKP